MKLLIMFFSMFLDILLVNIFRFTGYNISYFYPMFTISSVVYISNYYLHYNRKNYYFIVLLISIIYDTLSVNNLIITIPLFLLIAYLNIKLRKNFKTNLFNNIIFLIISILIYDLGFHLLLVLVKYQELNLVRLFYKFTHSLIINVIYIIVMFLVLKRKKA